MEGIMKMFKSGSGATSIAAMVVIGLMAYYKVITPDLAVKYISGITGLNVLGRKAVDTASAFKGNE